MDLFHIMSVNVIDLNGLISAERNIFTRLNQTVSCQMSDHAWRQKLIKKKKSQ